MKTAARLVVSALLVSATAGCGSNLKINHAKLQTTKRVAIVGVCQAGDLVVKGSGPTGRVKSGTVLVDAVAAGFDKALPSAWSGVEIVSLATVSADASITRHEEFKRRTCAHGFDPFLAKGITGDPDKVYMALLADKLNVDAVIAVSELFTLNYGGDTVRMTSGSLNPLYVHIVDRSGEQIFWASIKGPESANVPTDKDDSLALLGDAYAQVIATEFAKRLNDK